MALVSLTTTDGYDLKIGSETILMVVEQGTERKVFWDNRGFGAEVHEVTETLAYFLDADPSIGAGNLYQVTVEGQDVLLEANKTIAVAAEGSGSKIFYADKGRGNSEYITVETPAAIEALIDAL